MTFNNILVALDGSKNGQIAAEYGFWLASELEAQLTGMHVVDPRIIDLFLEREFAEELGLSQSVDTSEKVFAALRRVGKVILDLVIKEAANRGLKINTLLSEGYIVEEILRNESEYDLLIIGHRGQGQKQLPSRMVLGSVAERVTVNADIPVLITVQPASQIEQILVAYDGSEPSRGALLMAENLAKNTARKLKAVTVVSPKADKAESRLLVEEGESYLREYWADSVFSIKEGAIAQELLEGASSNTLLVIGAYGFREPDANILGSTTTGVIRQTKTSVLVYKPNLNKQKFTSKKDTARVISK